MQWKRKKMSERGTKSGEKGKGMGKTTPRKETIAEIRGS
jgi:hypothetical protein